MCRLIILLALTYTNFLKFHAELKETLIRTFSVKWWEIQLAVHPIIGG